MAFISGTSGNDNISGTTSDDDLRGQGGNDVLVGGDGHDYMEGNTGNDSLFGGNGNDNMRGNEGDDLLAGAAGNDYMAGGTGNDAMFGEAGNDDLRGEDGNDALIAGDGNDFLSGGTGDDYIVGEAGNDHQFGEAGNDDMRGGDGHDFMSGDAGNDYLSGDAGDDYLLGDAGQDRLDGGDGNDYQDGGQGNDVLNGGAGNDTMIGDSGTNTSSAGQGVFRWSAVADPDDGGQIDAGDNLAGRTVTQNVNGTVVSVTMPVLQSDFSTADIVTTGLPTGTNDFSSLRSVAENAQAGTYTVNFSQSVSNLSFSISDLGTGLDYVDIVAFNAEGHRIPLDIIEGSDLQVHQSNGIDLRISERIQQTDGANDPTAAAIINIPGPVARLTIAHVSVGGQLSWTYLSDLTFTTTLVGDNDHIDGGQGADLIFGGAGNDTLDGGGVPDGEIDTIFGGAGDDAITPGAGGADLLYGGDGRDTLSGGLDVDVLYGDAGDDVLYADQQTGGTSLEGADSLFGGDGSDTLILNANANLRGGVALGGTGADVVHGSGQGDFIDGGQGADLLYGGAGNDTLDGGGVPDGEIDTIFGGAGDDAITPGAGGADLLYGGDGRDTLSGGLDVDVLYGDAGDDVLYADQQTGGTSLEGADSLFGGDGHDTLILNANANLRGGVALGGTGADVVHGSGQGDFIDGGQGADLLYGGAGNDTLDGGGVPDGEIDTIFGGAGDDAITPGAGGADLLYGGDGRDTLSGGLDVDVLYGDAGDDVLYADQQTGGTSLEGADSLFGGDGHDTLILNANANLRGGVALGGTGADVVHGSGQGDFIDGGQGADLLYGGAGNDTLDGGGVPDGEIDTIFGGAGDDAITPGAGGADLLYGGDGRDTLSGGLDVDVLYGDAGDDVLYADQQTGGTSLEGADSLFGGDGSDTLILNANANLRGGFVDGGAGNDFAFGTGLGDLMLGGAGNDTLDGKAGNDSVHGQDGDDTILTDAGNDTAFGGAGNDAIQTGLGDDLASGDAGNDWFNTDAGRDTIYGGDGDDRTTAANLGDDLIYGGNGRDFMSGGEGNDTVFGDAGNDGLEGGLGDDQVFGGDGDDIVLGGAGDDSLDGGTFADVVNGGAGNDLLEGGGGDDVLYGGDGSDTLLGNWGVNEGLFGGAGNDVYKIAGTAVDAVSYDINLETGTDQWGRTISSIETVLGGSGNDTITGRNDTSELLDGGAGNDVVLGGGGEDSAFGGAGDDSLDGGTFADVLYGGAGNDLLEGGGGDDVLYGGDGSDTLLGNWGVNEGLFGGAGNDVYKIAGTAVDAVSYDINLETGTDQWGRTISSIETVLGGSGNDTITGRNDTSELLDGGAGNDVVLGGGGEDSAFGGAGDDSLDGGTFADVVYGGAGNDLLEGGGGDDVLYGGDGSDTLLGNWGVNEGLFGGAGNDVYKIAGTAVDAVSYDINLETGTDQWGRTISSIETVLGGSGNDTITGRNDTSELLDGGAGNDVVLGGGGEDSAFGGAGDDAIQTGLGDDLADGGAGNDWFNTDAGNDTLFGGDGNDTTTAANADNDLMYGGNGNDFFAGGDGDDSVYGDAGNDGVEGNAGNDLVSGGDGDDDVLGGAGDDVINGDAGDDFVTGGTGNDAVFGGAGDDHVSGGAGDDELQGGDGDDIVAAGDAFGTDIAVGGEAGETAGDAIDLTEMTTATQLTFTGDEAGGITSAGAAMTFSEFEMVYLGSGNDVVTGNGGDNTADAGAGNDVLNGGAGSDSLSGGAGDDLFSHNLAENAGANDRYDGGAGSDELHISVTAAEWANPLFQTDVAGLLAHIASANPAPFVFASTGLTVVSIERFTVNIDGVPTDPVNALAIANADTLSTGEDGPAVAVNLLANDSVLDRAGSVTLLTPSALGTVSITADLLATPQTAIATFTPGAGAQALNAGEVVTEVLTYRVTDVDGSTSTASLTITLTGANDAAAITGLAVGAIAEDALAPVSGSLSVADVDNGQAAFQAPAGLTGTYGSFAFDAATGAWSYTPNTGSAALESLAVGTQVSDSLTVTSLDGTASQTITVTITGTNDAPTLTAGVLAAAEDGPAVTLNLATLGDDIDSDDSGASLTYTITGAPSVGTASITGTTLTYNGGAGLDALAVGETLTTIVTVTATDRNGASVSNDVTVTITGTNDAPTLTAGVLAAAEDGPAVTLNLATLGDDIDSDNTGTDLTYTITGAPSVGTATITGTTLTYNGGAGLDALAVGETLTTVVTVTATDRNGASVSNDVTVTITGTNDAPTLQAAVLGAQEDGPAVTLNLATLGDDIDSDNTGSDLTYTITGAPSVGTASITGTTLTYNGGAGLDALAVGETLTTVVTVTATDRNGASVSNDVTVTITGTNDAPTLTAGVLAAAEDGPAVTLNLATLGDDIDSDDSGASLTYTITGAPSVGTASITGTTLTYNGGAGLDALAVGETLTTIVTVTATDRNGASVSNDVTVTITGTNDAPTLTAGVLAAAEDGPAVTLNLATLGDDIDSDDSGASLTYTITGAPSVGTASITGTTLTYNGGAGLDALAVGETLTTIVTVTATDRNGASVSNDVTVTITGTNDAPTLTAGVLAAAEDGPAVTLNLATLGDDIDSDNTGTDLTYTITGAPSVGTATITGTTLTYNGGAGLDALAVGETLTTVVTVTATDRNGASVSNDVTVTITGTNDAPTLTAGVLAAAEDGPAVTLNLATLGDDIDSDNTGSDLTYTITGAPSVGTASITGTTLTYNGGAGLDALAVGETLTTIVTVTATDRNGASVSNDVTVTITGTNDAPTLQAAVLGAQEDGPAVTLNLATLGDDVDSDNTGGDLTYTITGAPSVGTASITGTTLTYNGGAGLDALAVGETRTTVVTVTATDRNGASTSNDVTVTITGTNDAPTLTAGVLAAAEDGPAVTLNLATLGDDIDSDDSGASLTYTITGAPSVGTASITGTTLTYNGGAGLDALAVGETLTTVVTVTATDRNGASVSNDVTVTITGTNDAPTLTAGVLAAAEDGPAVTLNLATLGDDIDSDNTGSDLTYTITGAPSVGTATITGTTLTYNGGAGLDALAVGETLTTVVTVTATDRNGASVSNDVTVTITGTNDAPTLQAAVLGAQEDGPAVTLDLSALGDDIDSDDSGASLTYTITGAPSVGTASITGTTLTYNGGAGLDALAVGETRTTIVTVTATDRNGASVSNDVTVTITGTNDTPTLTAGVLAAAEDGPAVTLNLATLGDDIDSDNTGSDLTYTITGAPSVGTASITGTTLTYNGGAGLDALAVGETRTTIVTVTATDRNGASVSNDVTVTITGTNDTPTLTAGVLAAAEDGPAVTLNLATLGDDIDSDNTGSDLTYTITGAPSVGTASITGTQLSYTAGTAFQNLAQGETATQDIEVTATDRNGAAVTSTVTVTLTGTNDAPEIVMQPGNAPTITDLGNGQIEVSGTVQFTDADFSNTHFVTALDPLGLGVTINASTSAQNGALGAVTWSYVIDADDFVAGSDQTITLFVNDLFGAADQVDVTFTVPDTGNSLPDVSTPITVFNIVGEGVTAVNIVNFYVDTEGDPLAALADPLQQYPGISFTGTGLFLLNCDDPAYQFLIDGQTQTFSYTYLVNDGSGNAVATLEWTIQGSREGIIGTAGADVLVGDDDESELLNGGAGDDSLTGGAGDDIFAYLAAGDGFDLITDFAQFEDRIGVSASAFGGNLKAGTAPTVLNTIDYTSLDSGGTDGVFIFQEDFTGGTLYWDANGGLGDDAIAIAQLTNVTTLTADDFFLFI